MLCAYSPLHLSTRTATSTIPCTCSTVLFSARCKGEGEIISDGEKMTWNKRGKTTCHHSTILHFTLLYFTSRYSASLLHTSFFRIIQSYIIPHSVTRQRSVLLDATQHTAPHLYLHHTALISTPLHCAAMQHTTSKP